MKEFRKSTRRCESQTYCTTQQLFDINCNNRRHSCLCNQCGRLSEFQIRNHDVQKTDDMKQLMKERAKMLEVEAKRLSILEGRIKTSQDVDQKIELFCQKRRKSCYCSECGNQSLFEKKSQDIAYYSSRFLCTKFQIFQAQQTIIQQSIAQHTQNTKSKFYLISKNQSSFSSKLPSLHSQANIMQPVHRLSKFKFNTPEHQGFTPEHKVGTQQYIHSTIMEIGSPKNKCRTFESSPKNYMTPYLKPQKGSAFAFKLPLLKEFKKIDQPHRYYLTKHD